MTRHRCSVLARGSHGPGSCWPCPLSFLVGCSECAQKIYGSLGPAFYGLRTSLLTLLLMALWRIKRPEGLKEHSPQDLGRVLGLDRAPEVKTLRRKLARLAAHGRAAEFGGALAQRRVAQRGAALGFQGEEYALDALAEYAVVPDDPTREVPNPAWADVDAKLRQAEAHLDRLQAEYGLEALTSLEGRRPSMRGFKIAKGKLGLKILSAMQRVMHLQARRAKLPRRIPVQALSEEPVVKLAPERKHLTNLIKMVAYQAEGDLVRIVGPYYRRVNDEGRTLIQSRARVLGVV